MSANLENAIQEKIRRLNDEEQEQVMAFLERFERRPRGHRNSRFSLIGIARSGKTSLSNEAESILNESVDRREGWSLH